MATELILLEDVQYLGKMGDVVNVSNGYARNYLFPKKLASDATSGALRQLEVKKKKRQELHAKKVKSLQEIAQLLEKHSITIPVLTGENDKLYGSVSAQQIIDALKEMDVSIEKKQVGLSETIRELGKYTVEIYLHPEVTANLKVWIVKGDQESSTAQIT